MTLLFTQVQLILPEALKLLPLFSLALHKSPILRPDVRPDERSLWLAHMMGSSCGRVMGLLHPRLFAVHQLLVSCCFQHSLLGSDCNAGVAAAATANVSMLRDASCAAKNLRQPQQCLHSRACCPCWCALQRAGSMPADGALPEPLILSSEMLDEGGVYLLDSGADLLLYVDQSVNDQIVQVCCAAGRSNRSAMPARRPYTLGRPYTFGPVNSGRCNSVTDVTVQAITC